MERVTELIGVRANNFVTSFVTSAVCVDLAPVASIESAVPVLSLFFFFKVDCRKVLENVGAVTITFASGAYKTATLN
jgi:hypothetical protein